MALQPCSHCSRHHRATETICPFCGGEVAAPRGERTIDLSRPLGRAAILFASATALAACTGGPGEPTPTSSSSGTSGNSSSGTSSSGGNSSSGNSSSGGSSSGSTTSSSGTSGTTTSSGAVALYGPAPVDAGG